MISALETLTGHLDLKRAESQDILVGTVPGTPWTLYIYGDEIQVDTGERGYRRERWDFATPEDSIADVVAFVRKGLRSNSALELPRAGGSR